MTDNRLIWDYCSATADRRPTTVEDIREDIHVEDYNSASELVERLCDLINYDSVEEFCEESEIDVNNYDEIVEAALNYLSDPGDGSPNILYCKVNGKVVDNSGYYDMADELDLATASEEEVIDYLIQTGEFEDEDY